MTNQELPSEQAGATHTDDTKTDDAQASDANEGSSSRIAGVASSIVDHAGPVISAALTPVRSLASGANQIMSERDGARVRRVRAMGHSELANLWDLHPDAQRASIRELGLLSVVVDQIKGTAVEGPSQRGGDFLPLKERRSEDWRGRWQRILGANERLEVLPPIELIKFGDDYWVVDGHNRVAAALYNGQIELDAVVEELRLPGNVSRPQRAHTNDRVGARGQPRPSCRRQRPTFAHREQTRRSGRRPPGTRSRCRDRRGRRCPGIRMIRHVGLPWPDNADAKDPARAPVRLLAVSDEPERAFDFERNRAQIGRLDAVLGCGDLRPDYLAFLADAFCVPLLYVRGNHDRGVNWKETGEVLPGPLNGKCERIGGVSLIGLSWPGEDERSTRAVRDESAAWGQALRVAARPPRHRPLIVLSHVPPRGYGDTPEDDFHRGFAGYEWLCKRLQPTLWLHGHTPMAAARDWRVTCGATTLVNVTGAVLVEIGNDARPDATINASGGVP